MIFFSTFIKFGWGDKRWGNRVPTESYCCWVDRVGILLFSFGGPGLPQEWVSPASAGLLPLPRLLPPPALFSPSRALLATLTDTPVPRQWSVSVRRGRRGNSRVRWRRALAPGHRAWGAGSWNTGGSGC